jgi:AcrR family transcriptional regulator
LSSGERRKKEKENRKNVILKEARKLFFEKGFKSVTVDNIAASAELSKGSIYLYFESKEEIYVQILIMDIIDFHKRMINSLQKEASASDLLLEFAKLYVDFFLHEKELFRIFMAFMIRDNQATLTAAHNQSLLCITNENIQIIAEIIRKGVDSGEFPSDINIRQGQNAIWGLLNGIIALYLFTGEPSERATRMHSMVKDSLRIFIAGLKESRNQSDSGFNCYIDSLSQAV